MPESGSPRRMPRLLAQISRRRRLEAEVERLRAALTIIDGYALTVSLTAADEAEQLIASTILTTTHNALRAPRA